ncbi:MAG TPA: hypothetical protein H9861_02745 [Candidatus Ligilactobacillus excrementigallinarum]|uniref:Uncharacterized protein n=1 Tax=Candidatus Ligilactobacillus excrementigallinarum TaxID=2838641 RepID=A0A9D1UWH9_9LACO|nr:hypothetical protein [Candidatus Ligilactobacillus excrementigallinarum]
MKHLKRNLILIFLADTLLLIACLAFSIQQIMAHPHLSFGMILLLIVDFVVLSSFISLLTVAVQYFVRKIKERKK